MTELKRRTEPKHLYSQAAIDRFWSKVDRSGDCWIWTGCTVLGYGRFRPERGAAQVYAHRFVLEIEGRELPSGMVVDHLCRAPSCVRPEHLEVVTNAENVARGRRGFSLTGRCLSGAHDVTIPGNVGFHRSGHRYCRPCRNLQARRARARSKEALRK